MTLFPAAALSRRDGSVADGVHLLWMPPASAGYSVDGWDIQRRKASDQRPRPACFTLSPGQLDALHTQLRFRARFGEIRVRAAHCPQFPSLPPDEPAGPPEPPRRTCVSFSRLAPGRGSNPRTDAQLGVEVFDPSGAPASATFVRRLDGFTGLDCGFRTVLRLPGPTRTVEVSLVHFSQPAEIEAFNADGTSAGTARMSEPQRQAERLRVSGSSIVAVEIRAPQDETLLLEACFERLARRGPRGRGDRQLGRRSQLPRIDEHERVAAPAAPAVASLAAATARRCIAYDIVLVAPSDDVEVRAGLPGMLAIALRDGKAVDALVTGDPSGTQTVRFVGRAVNQVTLYASVRATALRVCATEPRDPREEEAEWANEAFIAKGLQVPIQELDHSLGSDGDEESVAQSRLLPGEGFDPSAFRDVADLMGAAAADVDTAAPVWFIAVSREDVADALVELRTWPYALALLVDPAWRRMLGFGFLDGDAGLTPGDAYDYRIIGRFRRRDVEERLHGFHMVPRDTTLPASFQLGSPLLRTPEPAVVELEPSPPAATLRATGRKGIAVRGDPALTISFPAPVDRVVLELAPGSDLRWRATTTDFVPIPSTTFGGTVPADTRVVIEPAEPIDTIVFEGSGFLYGVREVLSPPGTASKEVITATVVLPGVVYEDTPLPESPTFLGTLNLQQPVVAGRSGPPEPPASLGFRLNWLPPPPAGASGPVPWPDDLAAYPPFDVLGFHLERRRVDTSGGFEPIDGAGVETLAFGSRSGRRDPPALQDGIDLEATFPELAAPVPPVPVFMSLDDVLVTAEHGGPPPGSTHQYRIFSLDAIGRRSSTACLGSVARLEKRQPPPQPAPPQTPPPAGAVAPAGVRARILQAVDPDLADDDRTLLGTSANAVVLEWGWTQEERDRDPHATEFRVYWQPLAPDVVTGRLSGTATLTGGSYEMSAQLDRPVAADALAGRYIAAPARPFKVQSNTAGQTVTVRLAPSVLAPGDVPAAADFDFRPVLTGAEQRPPAWAERSAIVPITAADTYRHVFRDRVTLGAAQKRARVWTGVSAADAQSYIADALPSSAANGGRPGNESAIVVAPAVAHYLGGPTFTVPPPLPDVPESVTDEPAGESVTIRVDLPALLSGVSIPAGHRVQLDRIVLDDVAARMSARADDTIGADLPDGTAPSYTLGNPSDQAALLAQIRSSTPARVEGRFLMDFLLRFAGPLEPLWQPAMPAPVAFGALMDALPGKAARHVHRIRLADQAGHLSAGAAIVPQIVRVPSLRSPTPPQLDMPSSQTDALGVTARVRDAFDVRWVVLFADAVDAAAANGSASAPAQLLRVPNRRDLYPNDGLRLRLPGGTLLAPAAVIDAATGTSAPPDRVLTATLTPGHERRVSVWAATLTRDGIPSRIAGPAGAFTGPTPLVVPALTVTSAAGTDHAQWSTPAVPALTALERSTDGGATWRQVSPWLAETVVAYDVPSAAGTVRYRLALRADRGRNATGSAVIPS